MIAIFLVVLPFLGFPRTFDMLIVSLSGILIALTTFLGARERRMNARLGVSVEPVKKRTLARTKKKKVETSSKKVKQKEQKEEHDDTEDAEGSDTTSTHSKIVSTVGARTEVMS